MPVGQYKDFAECVRAQRLKGRSEDSARRICGEMEKKMQQEKKGMTILLPASTKLAVERSHKALKFLEQNASSVDTSYSSPQKQIISDNNMSSNAVDEESYSDKITRIMDQYNVNEPTAIEVVNRLIAEEQAELQRRQFEIQKEIEIQRAQSGGGGEEEQQQEQPQPTPTEQEEQQQQNVSQ